MKNFRLLALLATLALVPFALSACMDDESEDEDEITEVITRSATESDPASCTEDQTQDFLEQTSGETGPKAVEQCEEDQDEPVADSVEVSEVEVDGESATAVVAFTGGFIDGQSLDIGLAKEDDRWKLDELVGFAEFDRAAYVDGIATAIEEEGADADCVRQNLEDVSDEDLQASILEGDNEALDKSIDPCFEGQGGGAEDEPETETGAGAGTETTETESGAGTGAGAGSGGGTDY